MADITAKREKRLNDLMFSILFSRFRCAAPPLHTLCHNVPILGVRGRLLRNPAIYMEAEVTTG